jgi:hypothetical protein
MINGVCTWGYDDDTFVKTIKDILIGDDVYKKNVLKISSCWKGNLLSEAMVNKLIKMCGGDSLCIETIGSIFDPMCHSGACSSNTSGANNYKINPFGCDTTLTINTCVPDIDGSVIDGDVECNICSNALLCDEGDEGGGGGGGISIVTIVIIILILIIIGLLLYFILKNRNK